MITDKKSLLECNEHHNDFEFIENHTEFPYEANLNLVRSGVEAIIQVNLVILNITFWEFRINFVVHLIWRPNISVTDSIAFFGISWTANYT